MSDCNHEWECLGPIYEGTCALCGEKTIFWDLMPDPAPFKETIDARLPQKECWIEGGIVWWRTKS